MTTLACRFQPLRATKALRALFRDPDDTAQVFTVIESLSGAGPRHLLSSFRADTTGKRLLRERPDIVPLLADRERLRRMPEGSLGRAYLAFVESEGITADGLVAASEAGRVTQRGDDPDLDYVAQRMRDTHDLWHAVTGYKGDLIGEAALLAFNVPQTKNPGIALIVSLGILRIHQRRAIELIVGGFRRGAKARWLPAVDWEALLELPNRERARAARRRRGAALRAAALGDAARTRTPRAARGLSAVRR